MALSADMIITNTRLITAAPALKPHLPDKSQLSPESKLSSSKIQKYGMKWVGTGDIVQDELCQESSFWGSHHCIRDMNNHDHILNPHFCCVDSVLYLGTQGTWLLSDLRGEHRDWNINRGALCTLPGDTQHPARKDRLIQAWHCTGIRNRYVTH